MNYFEGIDFEIVIPTCRFGMAEGAASSIFPYKTRLVDGTNAESFSWLVNRCILSSATEVIIIMNDKVRADTSHIEKIIRLLNSGYGLASLYLFGFFGLTKQLIREIGWFDERFKGGGFEDVDFQNRLIEANIATYKTTEAPYLETGSSWKSNNNKEIYEKKWREDFGANRLVRLDGERPVPYIMPQGPIKINWLPHDKSSVLPPNNVHLRNVQVWNKLLPAS